MGDDNRLVNFFPKILLMMYHYEKHYSGKAFLYLFFQHKEIYKDTVDKQAQHLVMIRDVQGRALKRCSARPFFYVRLNINPIP
ncbi:hypothetical protein SAMN04488122_4921 [Chitinophaga arvensicola]|uniref:Uncharacterized protein n=1 Tax=Chitinophaga arvensicola TaxID=29529 RepID=A0A1I0S930_9BACT|nr:hypothetical protein SAMN04488122_4921 [Chitinophaga arvensicola]